MPVLEDLQVGVMFWARADPQQTIREQKELGVRAGQLGIEGDYPLAGAAEKWKRALEEEQFTIVTVFAAYTGESYADMATVQRTVGFIPPDTRPEREKRTYEISDFAKGIGVASIALHVGFVPHDPDNEEYIAVRNLVRRIADHAARNGLTFALETGQEPADVLDNFLRDVDRPNVKINFDPANMIMYGSGDPIQALDVLARNVVSVHCKDGEWPDKGVANSLGFEKPLGEGAVGMDKFIAKLKQIGYTGILSIEHEIADKEQKKRDIRAGVELLERLRKQ
jgi:L-ribulose-5-phosphate 3-epimerase